MFRRCPYDLKYINNPLSLDILSPDLVSSPFTANLQALKVDA